MKRGPAPFALLVAVSALVIAIVSVNGRSPLALMATVQVAAGPVPYEVERGGKRFTVALAPTRCAWHHLPAARWLAAARS